MEKLTIARAALATLCLVAAACSGGGSGSGGSGSGGSGSGGSSSGGSSGGTLAPDASPSGDGGIADTLCAYKTDGSNQMTCASSSGFAVTDFSTGLELCSGDPGLCAAVPSSITLKITSTLAVPLTVTLLYCPDTFHSGADCVPASREMGTAPLSITTSFGQPNGNVGPAATFTITQTGPSAGACSNSTDALGTDIEIADPYGHELVIPYVQTACCATASTPCP